MINVARSRKKRSLRPAILIVTNGERTERTYLTRLKSEAKGSKLSITVQFLPGEASTLLRKLDANDLSGYTEIWIVVDEDGRDLLPLIRGCEKRTRKNQLWVPVISRPCFEVWLIAHYERVKAYHSQADAQRHLGQITGRKPAEKSLPTDFPFENMHQACVQCELPSAEVHEQGQMPPSPGSGMVHLVQRLLPGRERE